MTDISVQFIMKFKRIIAMGYTIECSYWECLYV